MRTKLLFTVFTLGTIFLSVKAYSQPYQNGVFWIMKSQQVNHRKFRPAKSEELLNLKAYPNPTKGIFTIEYKLAEDVARGYLRVVDLKGSILGLKELTKNQDKLEIDLGKFPNGQYFVELWSETGIIESRIIVKM